MNFHLNILICFLSKLNILDKFSSVERVAPIVEFLMGIKNAFVMFLLRNNIIFKEWREMSENSIKPNKPEQ